MTLNESTVVPPLPHTPPSELAPMFRTAAGYVVSNLATYLVAKGALPADQIGPFSEWILTALPWVLGFAHTLYSWYLGKNKMRIAQTAAIIGVRSVVMDTQSAADSITVKNVVGPKDPLQ